MPLRNFMTTTASTTRNPALSGGKIGAPTTNLTNLKICPLMMPSAMQQQSLRQTTGLEGAMVTFWETYTESHLHTDSGVQVTQMPDIMEGDRLVVDGVTYTVKRANQQSATSGFGKTLILYLLEDERA